MPRVVSLLSGNAKLCLAAPVLAQDTSSFVWDNATEFSFVSSSGNASSNTLGLKSTLTGSGDGSTFKLEIGGIRASSNFTTRTAIGTLTTYSIVEETRSEQSAANYFARSRYDHDLGAGFAFGGAGWGRNTFSGIDHRYSFVLGLGKSWVDGDAGLFKTDLGATYTIQKDVSPTPGAGDGFGGARATIEATRSVTSTTDLATTLIVDENLRDTEDLRADWVLSIAVGLTEGLQFKTSYQILYDNDPALIGVPLLDVSDNILGEVTTPSQKVDSFLTLSLVIKL